MSTPERRAVRVSKYLAKHLRHSPQNIGIELEAGGWVGVDLLLRAASRHGFPMTREELDAAVDEPTKRRYAYNDTRSKIRAVQGHSAFVDLGYQPSIPPAVLFHGTNARAVEGVFATGLQPMRRQHVHLSEDVQTARVVGARRGQAVVLRIDAAALHADGHEFFRADNGVWLTSSVPAEFIAVRW